jgi:hypothetical protein
MLHIRSVAIFAEGLFARKKPDRYAAAVCITVRPDCLLRGYSVGERCRPSRAPKGVTDLRRYPDAMRFSLNGYFFFFLAVFFAFFAFFAFLAMFPSVIPKVGSMQVDIDMHTFRIHHNRKIDTARFKEGKRPPHRRDLRPDEALA